MSISPEEHAELMPRLAAIADASDDAIISKTLEGVITAWNPAAEKMFGYRAHEAIGQRIALIIPPERVDEEEEILRVLQRGDAIEHFETVRVAKGGQPLRVLLTVLPIKDRTGRIIGATKIARDIGERERADAMRARLAAIVDSSEDAIVSKTLDGIITSWNAAAGRMFGYTAREAVGRHITLIIPEDRLSEEDEVIAKIRRGETVDHFDTVRVDKSGTPIDISLTVSPIRNALGHILGASKIARDITERKRAEAERASLLAREQAARAEAEVLSRSKDEFLATLSHELRTPLNAIFGWARMLQSAQDDPGLLSRAIDAIIRNATAQVRLVEDLLDVSRIVMGNMRLDVQSVDLKAVVEAALETVRPAANAKGVRLQVVLDPRPGRVVGAPDRLQQVVWNLLSNAVKFTPKAGRVQVWLQRMNSHVEIVVSDTGEGIARDVLPYVFDRFRQADSTSTRRHGGLGIGLALVRHLVDLHGGTVTAASAGPGQGATFVVKLPVSIAAEREANVGDDARTDATSERTPALAGIRILVVDDDIDGLDLANAILTSYGAHVRTCVSTASALDTFREWPPDVLVADIEMPVEDGYVLRRKIRELEHGRTLPAIALTAYSRPDDRRRTLGAGFMLHLSKPVDPTELALAVSNVARPRR